MAKMFVSKMIVLKCNKTEGNHSLHSWNEVATKTAAGLKKGAQMAHLPMSRRMNSETGLFIR